MVRVLEREKEEASDGGSRPADRGAAVVARRRRPLLAAGLSALAAVLSLTTLFAVPVPALAQTTLVSQRAGTNTSATGKPAITGTARVGQVLTAGLGTITDADGLPATAFPMDYSVQWIRVDGATETDIAGAASATYTLTGADYAKKVGVRVSFVDSAGRLENRVSDAYPSGTDIVVAAHDVCGRTMQVRDAIVAKVADASHCSEVTVAHLAEIRKGLILSNSNITSLAVGDFAGLNRLGWLALRHNALTSLPEGIFAGLTRVDSIDLASNRLTSLPAGVFAGLTNLHGLALGDNRLTSLPAGVFAGLTKLCSLGLSRNALTSLPAGIFADQRCLGSLSLNDNALTSLPGGIFAGLAQLWALDLSNNALTSLPDGVFENLTRLCLLRVHGNPGSADFTPPANAGEDRTVSPGAVVTLDGSETRDTGPWKDLLASWEWVQVDAAGERLRPATVTLEGADGPMPSFTAPAAGTLHFRLTVTGRGFGPFTASDTVTVTVGADTARTARFTAPITAQVARAVKWHDGTAGFDLHLTFSHEPAEFSYRTMRDGLFDVEGGRIVKARRLVHGRNSRWTLSIIPDGPGDVTLAARVTTDCATDHAVCDAHGRKFAGGLSVTIPGPVVSAQVTHAPEAHNGTAGFNLHLTFSHEPAEFSYRTVRDGLFDVEGGHIAKARRLERGRNSGWELSIIPDGPGEVTLAARVTTDCAADHAVCDAHGRKFAGGLSVTIPGPVVSVADARVAEAEGARLDFVVSLRPVRDVTTTVAYATSDGTTVAGADYTAASGTLTFARGETEKTVSVMVLDDAHDEGEETLTLTLSSPSGARIGDGTATGTIRNDDPLQRAWLSRFGRTVGTHVVDAVGARLRGSPGQGAHLTVGGARLPLGRGAADPPGAPGLPATTGAVADGAHTGLPRGPKWYPWLDGPNSDLRLGQSRALRMPDVRQLLLESSFRLNLNAAGAATPRLTAWGGVAGTTFDGRDGTLTVEGDVLTGTVGVDGGWDQWLVGVAAAHSQGEGGSAMPGLAERGTGELESTLTSVHPYLRYAVTDRLDVWGLLGYGWGEAELDLATGETFETDTQFRMGAFGGRGILLAAADNGGVQLATRTDALLTRTSSDAATGLAATNADVHRWRVILEGSRGVTWEDGRSLTPTVEVGLRHDWGNAETGFGLELGGRVRYADPALGLTIEGALRVLLAHEDSAYQEWGASGTVRLAPGPAGRGLSVTLAPTWGAATGGVEGLWSRQTTAGLAPATRSTPTGRLAADVGYGLPAPFGSGLLTPYAGTVLAASETRTYRVGARLQMSGHGATGVRLSLEGQRQEPGGAEPATRSVHLQVDWGF